jgi:hypothetical protein
MLDEHSRPAIHPATMDVPLIIIGFNGPQLVNRVVHPRVIPMWHTLCDVNDQPWLEVGPSDDIARLRKMLSAVHGVRQPIAKLGDPHRCIL